MAICVVLTENALRYLKTKVTRRIGVGAFLSSLLAAEEAREEVRLLQNVTTKPRLVERWKDDVRVD